MAIVQFSGEARLSLRLAAAVLILLGGAACTKPAVTVAPPSKAPATLHELMRAHVDPSADFIWESVSSTTTLAGTEDKRPQTHEQWLAVRQQAVALIDSATLLGEPGLTVVSPGATLEDAQIAGISSAAEIQSAITADPQAFSVHARRLHDAGVEALSAIDAKDATALVTAGGHLDEACEGCHIVYWYPNTRRPPELLSARSSP